MYEAFRQRLLTWLRVPHEPAPPAGSPGSLRVFRAGRNYLRLRLAGWAVNQVFALGGIVFWTVFLVVVERSLHETPGDKVLPAASASVAPVEGAAEPGEAAKQKKSRRGRANRFEQFIQQAARQAERAVAANREQGRIKSWYAGYKQFAVEVGRLLPEGAFVWIWVLKIGGIGFYLVQLPLSYAARRLDYELRWYLVTDRSLRLREGVWSVQETTMSFANLQEVVVMQNPLQRVLGLADVQVRSAGGGGGAQAYGQVGHNDLHTGRFHAVTNATEVRDLILERLRKFRDAGLGDPEDPVSAGAETEGNVAGAAAAGGTRDDNVIAAAREAIAEAKALRAAAQ